MAESGGRKRSAGYIAGQVGGRRIGCSDFCGAVSDSLDDSARIQEKRGLPGKRRNLYCHRNGFDFNGRKTEPCQFLALSELFFADGRAVFQMGDEGRVESSLNDFGFFYYCAVFPGVRGRMAGVLFFRSFVQGLSRAFYAIAFTSVFPEFL